MIARCSKSYTTKLDLKRHVDSVHQGAKFMCATCGDQFTMKKYLAQHVKFILPVMYARFVGNAVQIKEA